MNNYKFTQLGYLMKCNETTIKSLTYETLKDLMSSEHVKDVMKRIKSTTDEEQQSVLKKQLPLILFQCQYPENGIRPKNENARPSGFCMHDWDHMTEDPSVFYWGKIAGREDELGIVLAHVTPRGHGLRLVTTMNAGETISHCQARIAALFGMQKVADTSIKDLVRASFLPDEEYLLYINEEGLFSHPAPEESQLPVAEVSQLPVAEESQLPVADNADNATVNDDVQNGNVQNDLQNSNVNASSIADSFSYEGIKYSTIIEALLTRIATQGKPCDGERNTDLYLLVRELRHICDYNFNMIYLLVSAYFPTLQDAEIRRTISNALGSTGRSITPVMNGIIAELKNQNVDLDTDDKEQSLPKLPKVSPVEEMILSKYPQHLRSHVFLSMLPIWGVYGTHIHFDYLDGRENTLSFMTAVVGKSGSGKAFAADLFDKMTKRFRLEDEIERKKADEYLAQLNKAAEGTEKPDDPRPQVRIYGDDITTSMLLDYLDNLNGEHGFQFTEEVTRVEKAKHTIYGDNDDLYCKSFDNAVGGKESKSKLTRNIRIKIYLNTLFCGTPGAMHKFYNNPEGGLNNRVIFVFMPNHRIKGFPHYGKFTEAEEQQFDEVCERLWQAGRDGKKIALPWLDKVITSLKNKWDKEDEENPNEVWYDIGKRSLVVGFRTGVLEWFLRGCPEDKKSISEIAKVVRWTACAMRQGVYRFSGSDYEKIAKADNNYQQKKTYKMTKNNKLFSLLPESFTVQDVIRLRVQNGDSADVYMVLSRWMQSGLILSPSKGCYHKVKELTA